MIVGYTRLAYPEERGGTRVKKWLTSLLEPSESTESPYTISMRKIDAMEMKSKTEIDLATFLIVNWMTTYMPSAKVELILED